MQQCLQPRQPFCRRAIPRIHDDFRPVASHGHAKADNAADDAEYNGKRYAADDNNGSPEPHRLHLVQRVAAIV